MVSSTVYDGDGSDWAASVRAIGTRTDQAGTGVTDLSAEEDRLIHRILTEGFLTSGAFQVAAQSPAAMAVDVGSGVAFADVYVVEGDDADQEHYLCRLDDATVAITIDPADASNPRIDEIWLVVRDAAYDAGSLSEVQLVYRKGDPAGSPSAPGPDAAWDAAVKLATIDVAASTSTIEAGDVTDDRVSADLAISGRTYWHDGNDGPGGGLDADTLDGAQLATFMASVEVDNSIEVASFGSVTSTWTTVATVNLTIPESWGGYKIEAHTTCGVSGVANATGEFAVNIAGTRQQALGPIGLEPPVGDSLNPVAVGGRRTGLSATGPVAVTFQAREITTAGGVDVDAVYLYARAVRTS